VSYDPNGNLLPVALANREALMAAQRVSGGGGSGNGVGDGAAKISQPAASKEQTGGGPNDNLLAIAMAEREKLMGSTSARAAKPAAKATAGPARPTRAAASPPKEAPQIPQSAAGKEEGGSGDSLLDIAMAARAQAGSGSSRPTNGSARATNGSTRDDRPSVPKATAMTPPPSPREKSGDSNGPNNNLLEIALAERAKGFSAPRRPASPTNGSARPAASAPKQAVSVGGGNSSSGPNDNLLEIALAERARAGSSPRRTTSPTNLRSSSKVAPPPPQTPTTTTTTDCPYFTFEDW